MRIRSAEFVHPVKFPTGAAGAGRSFERFADDHPENPLKDYALTWDDAAQELVVLNVKCGLTVGVPRTNIVQTRPAIGALARTIEAEWAKAQNPTTAAESPQAKSK